MMAKSSVRRFVTGVPRFSVLRLCASGGLVWFGWSLMGTMARDTAAVAGFIIGAFGLAMVGREIWIVGFHDGARSVPLDGAGLASGDGRAFDGSHYWNADLGAWEKRDD